MGEAFIRAILSGGVSFLLFFGGLTILGVAFALVAILSLTQVILQLSDSAKTFVSSDSDLGDYLSDDVQYWEE